MDHELHNDALTPAGLKDILSFKTHILHQFKSAMNERVSFGSNSIILHRKCKITFYL